MSKYCIITTRNIFDSPCLSKYSSILEGDFDIIYWNRAGLEEKNPGINASVYCKRIKASDSILKKAFLYYKFSCFCIKTLKKKKYSKLIIFPTQCAWMIRNFLKRKYKNRYVLDIRDYAGENKPLIKILTGKCINNAGFVSITSKKYEAFLPNYSKQYFVSHNIQEVDECAIDKYRQRKKNHNNQVINISFIGTVRFINQQKRIINAFNNDNRFVLSFIGTGSEELVSYCERNNYKNVRLVGFFEKKDISNYYIDTDIALNVYGNNNPYLDYALSNKLYSSAYFGMPILVSPNTYMSEIVEKYNIGFVFDMDDKDVVEKLYEYYHNLDYNCLFENCNRFIHDVLIEEREYREKLADYLRE